MNLCKDCRFWDATEAERTVGHEPRGRVRCRCLMADSDDSMMFVWHGIEPRQEIYTLNLFGCVQFEQFDGEIHPIDKK
jgi:hypothetical protein